MLYKHKSSGESRQTQVYQQGPAGMCSGKPSRSHLNGRHGGQEEIKLFFGRLPWQTPSCKTMAGIRTVLIFCYAWHSP